MPRNENDCTNSIINRYSSDLNEIKTRGFADIDPAQMMLQRIIQIVRDKKMRAIYKIIFITILLMSHVVYAFDLKNVAAYPVPFNPQKHNRITVDVPGSSLGAHNVKVAVYDINGDLVLEKTGSAFPFYWNGRNSTGRFVKPGLYILKIEVDDENGDYGKKIIRILVDY